ncbi:hypothetical protein [Persephonella sp.]
MEGKEYFNIENMKESDSNGCEDLDSIYSTINDIVTGFYVSIAAFIFIFFRENNNEKISDLVVLFPFVYFFLSSLIKLKKLMSSLPNFPFPKLIISKEGFYIEDKYIQYDKISNIFYLQLPIYKGSKSFLKFQIFIMKNKILNYAINIAKVLILFSSIYFFMKKEIIIGLILLFILTSEIIVKYLSIFIMSRLLKKSFNEISRYKEVLIVDSNKNLFFIFSSPECISRIISKTKT